jgi:hypothetical protein
VTYYFLNILFFLDRMDELRGEVCCNIEKWCRLMARLTVDQRARLALTNLRSMMMIPSVKMRTILIRYTFSHVYYVIFHHMSICHLYFMDYFCIVLIDSCSFLFQVHA